MKNPGIVSVVAFLLLLGAGCSITPTSEKAVSSVSSVDYYQSIRDAQDVKATLKPTLLLHGLNSSFADKMSTSKILENKSKSKTLVVFGDGVERGFYVVSKDKDGFSHKDKNWYVLSGAWEHQYLENVTWLDDSTVGYTWVVSDPGGTDKRKGTLAVE